MADWQYDPATGDWVLADAAGASPMAPAPPLYPTAPGTYPGATIGPYREVPSSEYPVDGVAPRPYERGEPLRPAPTAEIIADRDYEVIAAWEREARARGNEVRYTAAGTFEVDKDGRIVSRMPDAYRRM